MICSANIPNFQTMIICRYCGKYDHSGAGCCKFCGMWFYKAVQLQYSDANQYRKIFEPLVMAEADCSRREKESEAFEVDQLRWVLEVNKEPKAFFTLPKFCEGSKGCFLNQEPSNSY